MRIEVFEGDRAVVAVDGGGGMFLLSFLNDRDSLGRNLRIAGYFDVSSRAPPELLRRGR
jgi:hypothetical protein